MVLKSGVEDPEKFLSKEGMQKILKAALPHRREFIDVNEPEQYFVLLEEIESHLLIELRKILEGKEADQAAAVRAQEITAAIRNAEKERAEKNIVGAKSRS